MPPSVAAPPHDAADIGRPRRPDHLTVEQVTAVSRRASVLACGSLLCCVLVVNEFWQVASHRYLMSVLSVLVVSQTFSICRSIWHAKSSRGVSRWSYYTQCIMAALVAAAWATVPIVLLPLATADQREMLISIGVGLVAASVLLAPVLPAALLFAAISTVGPVIASLEIHHAISGHRCILSLAYFAVACGGVVLQSRDFARRVHNERKNAEQGDIIRMLLHDFEEDAHDFLWETDSALRLQRVSERLASVLGVERSVLHGASLSDWIGSGARQSGPDDGDAARLLSAAASHEPFRDLRALILVGPEPRWLSFTGRPVFDANGAFAGYRGVGSDATAIRRSDERIAYLARHDSLTGLPNRAQFRQTLGQACLRRAPIMLLTLDIDGFKSVNDTLGHRIGDALLVAVADRLRTCLPEGDLVARLGADEFAVMHAGEDTERARLLAQRLIDSVSEPYKLGESAVAVGLSIGVASPRDAGFDAEQLLNGADLALRRARADGGGNWQLFAPSMAVRAQERVSMQADLRRAIGGDALALDFQPIIDLASGQITAAEALVRWPHPTRGRVPPADFIPLAEECSLIVPLGGWVLRRACQYAATWQNGARVAVNLSPVQFRDPGLLALVDDALAESGLAPNRLELEITESVFLDTVDSTVTCLNALRSRGIHIALDDFGTGYSSLSYLRSFPFDKVKIDQSFIRDLGANTDAIAIVQAIVGMAGSLGMRTTGEGVETPLQAQLLQQTGCSQVQGYLYGRPCAPEVISEMMQSKTSPARARHRLEAPAA